MTNMMNGAVAIYGGVGVMEIRQPLPQTVESMAQAVEGLAVNAHISLRELKNTVAAVIEKKLPKYAQLMEMHPVIAARTVVGGATLTAYENGYAVYEEDGAHTVMAIDRCGDYRYDFNDGTYEVVPAAVFEDAEWSVRLVMEGERRMESNRSKTVAIGVQMTSTPIPRAIRLQRSFPRWQLSRMMSARRILCGCSAIRDSWMVREFTA